MSSLIVFDLESLTYRVPGPQFIQDPTNRILYPGVYGRLNKLRSQGWIQAIVSNQIGCAWQKIPGASLKPGMYFQLFGEDGFLEGKTFIAKTIEFDHRVLKIRTVSNEWFHLGASNKVLARHKMIEQAIEELSSAANLCGIEEFRFCHCIKGRSAIESAKVKGVWRSAFVDRESTQGQSTEYGSFLKSEPGLLNRTREFSFKKFDCCVFVGLDPEDRLTAGKAGFEFVEANDWRGGRVFI